MKRIAILGASGQGSIICDSDGREYLDFLSGIAVSALGHGAAQLRSTLHSRGLLFGTAAEKILRLLPPYVITAAEVQRAIEMIGAGLSDLQERLS